MEEQYYKFLQFRKEFLKEYYFIWEDYKCNPIADSSDYLDRCNLKFPQSFSLFAIYKLEILKKYNETKLFSLYGKEQNVGVMVCRPSRDFHIWFSIDCLFQKNTPRYVVNPYIYTNNSQDFLQFLEENQEFEIEPDIRNGAAGIFHNQQ